MHLAQPLSRLLGVSWSVRSRVSPLVGCSVQIIRYQWGVESTVKEVGPYCQ